MLQALIAAIVLTVLLTEIRRQGQQTRRLIMRSAADVRQDITELNEPVPEADPIPVPTPPVEPTA